MKNSAENYFLRRRLAPGEWSYRPYRPKHTSANVQCWALQTAKFDATLGQAPRFVDAWHTLLIRPTLLSGWSEIIAATPHWLTHDVALQAEYVATRLLTVVVVVVVIVVVVVVISCFK